MTTGEIADVPNNIREIAHFYQNSYDSVAVA